MLASPGILWLTLRLPPSEKDRADELAALLASLRVPAAVRHSTMNDTGTFALIPSDGDTTILTVPDEYAPAVTWRGIPLDDVCSVLRQRFGPEINLDGELLLPDADHAHPDSDTETSPTASIDAIAWTIRKEPEFIAMLGARCGMSFDSVDAGDLGRALRPHLDTDRGTALDSGLWAMTDGIALWRRGSECAAVFMGRRRPNIASWHSPWVRSDPSKPGQTVDGALVRTWLDEVIPPDGEVNAWIAHFELDSTDAGRLRALFRREADDGILDELFDILSLDTACLDLVRDVPDLDLEVIEARDAREQFHDGMRAEIDAVGSRPAGFRHRHPRVWLTISLVAILILAGFSITGLAGGRMTALLPGIVALVWTASLFVDRAAAQAKALVTDDDLPDGLAD
ncbi:hypothetical protein KZC51_01220 [Microbacterium sp. SSW1-49]|uniref:Uncharacterized protein n=1 Tax=Microbacterium croceum TaxID=2851645 RepID=A0ABT0FAI2_9MICO|nr:hypothetical protein [Microbacterium croceum]MCK2034742.1 hypothetical protein [Microbacterium croceum]